MLFSTIAVTTLTAVSIFTGSVAQAAEYTERDVRVGTHKAVEGQNEFTSELKNGGLLRAGNLVINLMVREGISVIRKSGDVQGAEALRREWSETYRNQLNRPELAAFAIEMGVVDVGDHAPLFKWLETFHHKLVIATKGTVKAFRIVEDIATVNFALPVVFAPKGKWRSGVFHDDMIEYRKHFIAFANVGAYWASFEGCKAGLQGERAPLQIVCPMAASFVEWAMGRHIAPRISDRIYKRATSRMSIAAEEFSDLNLSYWSDEQLFEAVQTSLRSNQ